MNILLACQCSVYLRTLLREAGHNAFTCDLLPAEHTDQSFHIRHDAIKIAYDPVYEWGCMIAMPECRFLCSSGQHRTGKPGQRTKDDVERAVAFFMILMNAPIPHKAIENSVGIMSTRYRKPDQIIHPYHFGDDASKGTCWWLEDFPHLIIDPELYVQPRLVTLNGKQYKRWANQTDSGQNRMGPSPTRSADRARTWPGMARALADAVMGIKS